MGGVLRLMLVSPSKDDSAERSLRTAGTADLASFFRCRIQERIEVRKATNVDRQKLDSSDARTAICARHHSAMEASSRIVRPAPDRLRLAAARFAACAYGRRRPLGRDPRALARRP